MGDNGSPPKFFAELANNIFIREPMETIAPDSLFPKLLRQRKSLRELRHSVVKRRIKAGYLRQVWKMRRNPVDHRDLAGQMQWRKRNQFLQSGLQVFVNQLRLDELWAAMHNAMPSRRQPFNALPMQRAKHYLDGSSVVSKFAALFLQRFVSAAQPSLTCGLPNPFNGPGNNSFFRQFAESIHGKLQRRRTAVQAEDH